MKRGSLQNSCRTTSRKRSLRIRNRWMGEIMISHDVQRRPSSQIPSIFERSGEVDVEDEKSHCMHKGHVACVQQGMWLGLGLLYMFIFAYLFPYVRTCVCAQLLVVWCYALFLALCTWVVKWFCYLSSQQLLINDYEKFVHSMALFSPEEKEIYVSLHNICWDLSNVCEVSPRPRARQCNF